MVRVDNIPHCVIQYSQICDGDIKDAETFESIFDLHTKTLSVPHLQHGSQILQVPSVKNLDCDAVYTLDSHCALGIRVADCLPITLSAQGKGVAIIHGGWRSLLDHILEKTIEEFLHATNSSSQDLYVWIGPSIQACCNSMQNVPVQSGKPGWDECISMNAGEYHMNLQRYVRNACQQLGVQSDHITDTNICTYHQKDSYFSYRRYTQEKHSAGCVGHIGVVAWMER